MLAVSKEELNVDAWSCSRLKSHFVIRVSDEGGQDSPRVACCFHSQEQRQVLQT